MSDWRKIPDYDYEVNRQGDVRRIGGEIIAQEIHKRGRGYPIVELYRNGIRYRRYVHRLVAQAFIPNPKRLPIVNHIDGDTLNPTADNLEWVTVKRNVIHAYENGLNSKAIACEMIAPDGSRKIYHSMRELSKSIGKSPGWLAETVRRRGPRVTFKGYTISTS